MQKKFERIIDTRLILSIIAAGLLSFTGVVIETAMNITFPTLMREFAVNTATVQWLTTGYLLILAIIIPTSSFLKNRYKTRNLFIIANLLFILGVIIDAAAPNFSFLLIGRILQGCGTGIALPLMFNIVLEQVPFNKLGFMMGIATLVVAISPAVGPFFGGLIISYFGWRTIFIALLPLLIVSLVIGSYAIRQSSEINNIKKFDWTGYAFLAIAFSSFIFIINLIGKSGLFNPVVIITFAVLIISITLFVYHSGKINNPILHLSVFKCTPFTFSVLVLCLIQFSCLGLGFIIPNYAQLSLGKTPFLSGCLLLPGCLIGAALAPISGRILDKFGAKHPIIFGNICIIVAMFLYSFIAKNLTTNTFILFYIFFTIGQGFSAPSSMTNGIKQLNELLKSDGNAVCNTLQQLSGALGTAVVSIIISVEQSTSDNLAISTIIGSQKSFYILLVLSIATLFCSIYVFHTLRYKNQVIGHSS